MMFTNSMDSLFEVTFPDKVAFWEYKQELISIANAISMGLLEWCFVNIVKYLILYGKINKLDKSNKLFREIILEILESNVTLQLLYLLHEFVS